MERINLLFKSKNQVLAIIGLVILLIAIPLTMYLIRHPQIFKGRAAGRPPLEFFGAGVTDGTPPTTTSQNVNLKLTYGTGSAPSPSPSPTPTPTPTPTATPPPGSAPCTGGIQCDSQCVSGGQASCGPNSGLKVCHYTSGSSNCYQVNAPSQSCQLRPCVVASTPTPTPTPTPACKPRNASCTLGSDQCCRPMECTGLARSATCQ